jgi:zinc/manganese transport system substrate-binding protein
VGEGLMKKKTILWIFFLALSCGAPHAEENLRVLCSTSDLSYFASEIGGELVTVDLIADPKRDPHFVEVRPSFMIKARKADVVLKVGMELDLWMDGIIDGSRNSKIVVIDCSEHIQPIEIPEGKIDARLGDLHRYGNPHYWMTPENVKPITDAIVAGFVGVDPRNTEQYRKNQRKLIASIALKVNELQETLDSLEGVSVVNYHKGWSYFNAFTGIEAIDFIEPYPGVSPSPSHIKKLIELVRDRGVRVIAVDVYFDERVPKKIAEATGASVVIMYPSIGAMNPEETYTEWFAGNVLSIAGALK